MDKKDNEITEFNIRSDRRNKSKTKRRGFLEKGTLRTHNSGYNLPIKLQQEGMHRHRGNFKIVAL